jgi:sortase A
MTTSARAWPVAAERLLLAIAAIALGAYVLDRADAAREQAALSNELERSQAAFQAADDHPGARRVVLASGALVGRIEIPRLRLSALAREGVDTRTLRTSAGHVPGSALPGERGNVAFAAHRDTFFAPLKGVRRGDAITVTTATGVFEYVVDSTRIVEPEDVSVLQPTAQATLTLVTCYPFSYVGSAPRRFIVSARLVAVEAKPRV